MKCIFLRISDEDWNTYQEMKNVLMRQYLRQNGIFGHHIIRLASTNPEMEEKRKKTFVPLKIGSRALRNLKEIYCSLPDGKEFGESILIKAISQVAGVSKPTHSQYKRLLKIYDLCCANYNNGGGIFYKKADPEPEWLKEVKA